MNCTSLTMRTSQTRPHNNILSEGFPNVLPQCHFFMPLANGGGTFDDVWSKRICCQTNLMTGHKAHESSDNKILFTSSIKMNTDASVPQIFAQEIQEEDFLAVIPTASITSEEPGIASKLGKQCPLPWKPGLRKQRVRTSDWIMPATKHILASATIKWTPDGFNLPTEDEKLGTNMCFSHCWQSPLEGFSSLNILLHKTSCSFFCKFCNSQKWFENNWKNHLIYCLFLLKD